MMRMFGFARRISSASSRVAGREQQLDEVLRQTAARELGVDVAVQHDDAAEGALRVARERALVGLGDRLADRDAAGVVVLDDRRGRQLELAQQARGPSRGRAGC